MPEATVQTSVSINPELLRQLTRQDGGRVVFVIGAGCSVEHPTELPLARELSVRLHRQLVRFGTLSEGDCLDPQDLSALADAVVDRTGNQGALVECMDLSRFRDAQPNDGYLIAAALLREQAVASVLTLNFDLAMSSALTQLGAHDVGVINGPGEHQRLGTSSVIYLHRNVLAPANDLVLTTDALESSWQDQWVEIIAQKVVSSPATVFAGLGSPASVLVHCVEKIRSAIPNQTLVIQVDPAPHGSSAFSQALAIPPDCHTAMQWSEFMHELSRVLVDQWHDEIATTCRDLTDQNNWDEEDVQSLLDGLLALGIVVCGEMRAHWMRQRSTYLPWRETPTEWIADLLLAIRLIERETSSSAVLARDGTVAFHSSTGLLGKVGVAHGRGALFWTALEPLVQREYGSSCTPLDAVLVAGCPGATTEISPPINIANDDPEDSLVGGPVTLRLANVYDLRRNPASARELWQAHG